MEEQWFFEAISETYIPLLQAFERLQRDGIDFRLTLSLSPTLLSMLTDELLQQRFREHLLALVRLADEQVERTRNDGRFHGLAQMYRDRFNDSLQLWDRCDGNLIPSIRALQDAGKVELITCTATHAFMPLLDRNWAAFRAQVHVAASLYEKLFGRRTQGIWLGECGYVPGVDELLREEGIRYFFVDSHALLFAQPRPVFGMHAPVYCPTGVAAFARDVASSRQVWSSKEGYPGDPDYRDFYRDIGFDLPVDALGDFVHPDGIRTFTGIKYYAITHSSIHDKQLYVPHVAWQRANEHAHHFMQQRQQQAMQMRPHFDRPPIIVSPYDAELFGHWWFEGPIFLEMLMRKLNTEQSIIEPITPSGYLQRHPTNQVLSPIMSSWGAGGYCEYWCNETNAWVYRHLHKLAERMVQLAHAFPNATGLQKRALNQAARELMLAQSSDWAFIMKARTTVGYATQRTNNHINRFNRLYSDLMQNTLDEVFVRELEHRDNLFSDLDYRVYAT